MNLQDYADTTFLALTIWRESRGEAKQVQVAVGYSVENRVRKPGWWGHSLMEVVFKKWQYSSMTAPGDPNLVAWPSGSDPSWAQCLQVAQDVQQGAVPNPVPGADSYYDISIPAPKWASNGKFVAQIGRIKFYDLEN